MQRLPNQIQHIIYDYLHRNKNQELNREFEQKTQCIKLKLNHRHTHPNNIEDVIDVFRQCRICNCWNIRNFIANTIHNNDGSSAFEWICYCCCKRHKETVTVRRIHHKRRKS